MSFEIEDIDDIVLNKTNIYQEAERKQDVVQHFIRDRFIQPIKTELTDAEKVIIECFNDINFYGVYSPTNERELITCIKNAIPYIGNDGNFNWVDTSKLHSIAGVFRGMTEFNGDITNWNVSNITNMAYTFQGAKAFKRELTNWDMSNVTCITGMFQNANYPYKDLVKSWIKKYNIKLSLGAI